MNLEEKIKELKSQYQVVDVVDLDHWYELPVFQRTTWLSKELVRLYKSEYQKNERLVFVLSRTEHYTGTVPTGDLLEQFLELLNKHDISSYFVVLLSDRASTVLSALSLVKQYDPIPVTVKEYQGLSSQRHQYNSPEPVKISIDKLKTHEKHLLTESSTFCMYPWIHIHAYPTGDAYPCCHAEMKYSIGNCKTQSLEQLWNNDQMRQLRRNMISGQESAACTRCYEQEQAGFFSGRQSVNKHFGHQIDLVAGTQEDGTLDAFRLIYWDIRFSNLCNLSCRSCGHIFSSSWYQDQVKLAGPEWAQKNRALNIAGKDPEDMWNQLLPHIDYVEQIYFAGGEPLMMEEHYRILEELERRERFDVRLIYNTNFTQVKLKDRWVFDYWRKFKSVSVGASLDAMGPHAEYIRKGTVWSTVEDNRKRMLDTCPNVDFYISPTLSIMNAWHLPDFHRSWVDQGLIRAQDLNVNILQDPVHYRIDIAPEKYKDELKQKFNEHLEWLRPLDSLRRATVGLESAVRFMTATDNTHLIEKFWNKTAQLDEIRKENILDVIPELKALK